MHWDHLFYLSADRLFSLRYFWWVRWDRFPAKSCLWFLFVVRYLSTSATHWWFIHMTRHSCCAECGEEGGASLKMCKACMSVKYCNATCQMNHWPTHKKECELNQPSYAMRCCCLRTRRPRRSVRSASYQYQQDWYLVCHFHPRLYRPYQFTTSAIANEDFADMVMEE